MITDADRLRELLREHTPQPPRDVDLGDVAARVHAPARAPIQLRRLSPLAAIAAVAAVVVLVVALQHSTHNGKPGPTRPASPRPTPTSAPTVSPTPTHAPSRPVQPPAGEGIVYSTDVYSSGFAVVVVGPGPDGTGRVRLLATTNWGRTFADIGPRTSSDWRPDSLYVLDPSHMWLSVWRSSDLAGQVYRTSDGGGHWQSVAAGGHNAAGYSQVDFVDTDNGFLLSVDPNGPGGSIEATNDGGSSWRGVADLRTDDLPVGRIYFTTPRTGWIGGFFGALDRTDDGGVHWTAESVPGIDPSSADSSIGTPAIHGSDLLLPIQTSTSDGPGEIGSARCVVQIWKRPVRAGVFEPLAKFIASGSCPNGEASPAVSCPVTTDDCWAAALNDGLVVVSRWNGKYTDPKQWAQTNRPYGRTIFQPHIAATDADHAWLSFTQANNVIEENNTEVYRTSDAGRTWQRIDLTALATR